MATIWLCLVLVIGGALLGFYLSRIFYHIPTTKPIESPALPEDAVIMVVEDDPADLDLTLRSMQNIANDKRVATTVKDAMTILNDPLGHPDIVVLDDNLTNGTGRDILRAIRSKFGRAVKVIVATGYANESLRRSYADLGADMFVEKPVTADTFRQIAVRLDGVRLMVVRDT